MRQKNNEAHPVDTRRKIKLNIFIILANCALAVLNQVIYRHVSGHDEGLYITMAKEYCHLNFYDPVLNAYGHPFYSLFLALTGTLFSYSGFAIAIIQSVLFSLCAIRLIREIELYSNKHLWGILVLLAVVPNVYFYNGYFTTESLVFSLILLSFSIAIGILHKGVTNGRLFMLSAIIGITIMNRFESIGCIPPILFLIYPKIKVKLVRSVSIILLFPVCFLFLNDLKNYKIYHKFSVTDFHGGEAIYAGNNNNLDGSHHNFDIHKRIFLPRNKIAEFNKLDSLPAEIRYPRLDSLYKKLAIQSWKESPLNQLKVIPEKLAKDWLIPGNFDIYTNDTTKTKGIQITKLLNKKYFNNNPVAPYKHLFYMVIHWILLLLLIIGIWNMDMKNRFQLSVLFLWIIYLLYTIPFCGLPRWQVTIFPILIVAFTPGWLIKKINDIFYAKRY